MVDQRGRDDPPTFLIPEGIMEHKYHALLIEPSWVPSKLVFVTFDDERGRREIEGEVHIKAPRGLYGFPRVEDRKAFTLAINRNEDLVIAKAVTLTTSLHDSLVG